MPPELSGDVTEEPDGSEDPFSLLNEEGSSRNSPYPSASPLTQANETEGANSTDQLAPDATQLSSPVAFPQPASSVAPAPETSLAPAREIPAETSLAPSPSVDSEVESSSVAEGLPPAPETAEAVVPLASPPPTELPSPPALQPPLVPLNGNDGAASGDKDAHDEEATGKDEDAPEQSEKDDDAEGYGACWFLVPPIWDQA